MKLIATGMMAVGLLIFVAGIILYFFGGSSWLGGLPGDINVKSRNVSFHFPLVTCIIISIVLTVLLNIVLRFFRR
jgi:hypothetical protein